MKRTVKGIVTVFLLLCAVALALQVIPASAFAPAQSYPPPSDQTPEASVGANRRLDELNRVLGIPMEELERMTAKEVHQLYLDHAEQLGIVVYKNAWDYLGREIPKIIAGTRVRKPASYRDNNP